MRLAETWFAAVLDQSDKASNLTSARDNRNDDGFAEYNRLVAEYEGTYGVDSPLGQVGEVDVGPRAAPTPPVPPPASKNIGVAFSRQQESYYCGPAVGWSILQFKGRTRAHGNGPGLTQRALAGNDYMRTDHFGQTSQAAVGGKYYMAVGLNKWSFGRETGYYVPVLVSSLSRLQSLFVYSIYANEPFAVSTIEYVGGRHYNNHPNRLIGHWVTAYGYAGNGATIRMVDPASGLSNGYQNSAQRFSDASSVFYTQHTQGRRSVW